MSAVPGTALPAMPPLRHLAGPGLILLLLGMMVLPLPPFLLDVLFTFNIALSIMVLLVSVYTLRPLDFSVFPTVLLVTTLLRLALNVASTRVVLLHGHTGPDAAGKVIEAFGHFLVGGNYAIGIVVFIILVVINFVVITKGAGRIAEVSARFTLDAMPGKQMAIDADLNAGLIGEDEARRRRGAVAQEAEFYGAMDGASKFVRGDAIAGIVILLVNIAGGLVVGVLQHDLSLETAARNYTLLTIGDGLVAQIPALVVSTAAGMMVSRVASDRDLGSQFLGQVFGRAQVLGLTAAILGLLGLVPGMPHVVFFVLAGALGAAAYARSQQKTKVADEEAASAAASAPSAEPSEASWSDIAPVDPVGLEVGYRLIPLVDKAQDGELLKRIRGVRRKFAQEIGFLPPQVHIRDNLELRPGGYRITLRGVECGRGEIQSGMQLAINPGRVLGSVPGTPTTDPAFGLPALWIEASLREQAQSLGYTVADPSTVIATHLNHLLRTHAAEVFGRHEAQQLLEHVARDLPKLAEEVVPKLLPLATVQRVLQLLLEEGVHIRDQRTIFEALAEHAPRTQDATELAAAVRVALGRAITQELFPGTAEVQVLALDPELERLLAQAAQAGQGKGLGLEPGLAEALAREAAAHAERQEALGVPAVLLVPPALRAPLARLFRRSVPGLKVLSQAEVPDARRVRVSAVLGGKR